jgi:hypothetical protein
MRVPDFNPLQAITTLMLDDLHMGRCARDAKTGLRMRASCSLSGWIVSVTKYLRKQGTIGRQPISKQGHLMSIMQARRAIFQQTTNQRLIPRSLNVDHNELALRVHQLGIPSHMKVVLPRK